MGVAIPLGYVEDRASGALVVDGSLRFDTNKPTYLSRTPGSDGNRKTWSWSAWIKRGKLDSTRRVWGLYTNSSPAYGYEYLSFDSNHKIDWYQATGGSSWTGRLYTTEVFRDTSSWYHIVVVLDITNSTSSDRMRIYKNGQRITSFDSASYPTTETPATNSAQVHYMGVHYASQSESNDALVSQVYFIDGQALDPSYFGYTDALTNTWRPKKLSSSVAFGTNGFYLPFDGSAPIGQDQSGRGNDWTPVNFGGSNTLEKATGALPILNTDGGGKVARVGVRTDSSASSLVLALPLVGIKSDFSNKINSGTTEKAITANGDAAASRSQSNFYGGSFVFDGTGDYLQTTTESLPGDFCVEGWWYPSSSGQQTFFTLGDSATSTGIEVYRSSGSGYLQVYGGGGGIMSPGVDYTLNTWQHYALTRSGTTLRLFKNGVQIGSATNSLTFDSTLRIGVEYYSSTLGQYITGYVQDFRIYKGSAKYTSNFIPASTDPDILPDTPSGVSYTSNLTQITDGAISSGSASSYLTLASSADFGFGTGDFTVEFFVYETSKVYTSGYNPRAFDFGNTFQMVLLATADGSTIRIDYADSTLTTSNGTLFANKWNHIALVRSGSTLSLYINGVFDKSVSNSTNVPTPSNTIYIGRYYGSDSGWINGFISNFHVVKGTALYTANFTPPTGPISSVANTKLLCCQSNVSAGAATSSPNISGIINNGTVWSSTTNTSLIYGGSASMIFDGNATWSVGNYANFNPGAFTLFSGANVTANTSIRVYGNFASSDSFKINGTTYTDNANGSNQWIVPSGVTYPITVNSIVIDTTGGAQNTISAVEIDGTILTDPVVVYGNAAATNFNPFTVNINTQRGKQSGWCTLNPLETGSNVTLSNGNLDAVGTSSWRWSKGTLAITSGKWYWEVIHTNGGADNLFTGITKTQFRNFTYDLNHSSSDSYNVWGYTSLNGRKEGQGAGTDYGATFQTAGDVVGVALNMDTGTLTFYKNGVSQGQAFSGITGEVCPAWGGTGSSISAGSHNFGQKPFKFPPPAGFQPLALANTPRPTIVRPDQFVGVSTWSGAQSGSGGLTRQISLGMQPDFVWIKQRNQAYSTGHQLYDSVRGAGAEKELNSSGTGAEGAGNIETYGWLNSFDKNGFTVKGGSSDYDYIDKSGVTYVAWSWKAGGNSNTYNINDVGYATASAAGLTAGSITPTGASVNTKSGFSIITYTGNGTSGATVSHGLGNTPGLLIVKRRSNTGSTANWAVLHSSLTAGYNLFLNTTDNAQAYSPSRFTSTVPTSTVFSLGSGDETNYSGGTFVAYSWAEIPGFSKFGLYTGGGSAGRFIYTGFKPKVIWAKNYNSSSYLSYTGWYMWDSVRSTYNYNQSSLIASSAYQEGIRNNGGSIYSVGVDILSNGFCLRGADDADTNWTSGEYIYCAWGEVPTQNLYGAQANAR